MKLPLPVGLRPSRHAILSALFAGSASAATFQFNGGNGQQNANNIRWATANAWTLVSGTPLANIPGAGDLVRFDNPVAAAANVTLPQVSQSAGEIRFDRTGGQTVTLSGTGVNLTVTSSGSLSGTTTLIQSATITGVGGFSTVNLLMSGGTLTMDGSGGRSVTGNTLVSGNTALAGTSAVSLTNLHINSSTTLAVSGTGTKTISGRLSGSGIITGSLSLVGSGSIHSAGGTLSSVTGTYSSSVGSQTVDTVSYGSGSVFSWDLASASVGTRGTNYDAVNATSITAAAGSIFRIVLGTTFDSAAAFWKNTQTWDVFQATGISGSFSSFQLYDTTGLITPATYASAGSFTFNSTTGDLTWNAIPESSTALAGLLVAAGLSRRRRQLSA